MNQSKVKALSFLVILFFTHAVFSQKQLKGSVLDINNKPIPLVALAVKGKNITTFTNDKGEYVLNDLQENVRIEVSRLGYKTLIKDINVANYKVFNFVLEKLYENLNTVIVTGTFEARKQLESTTSVSVLSSENLQKLVAIGTADLLGNIPGTFVDASAGEVFTKVYSRGVSASAEDDLGWYYTSLQEDGLPVSLIQHSYFSPDLFYRNDLTTQRVEAIRDRKSVV